MQFLPQDKKKALRSVIILLIAVIGFFYINFFYGKTPNASPTDGNIVFTEEIPGPEDETVPGGPVSIPAGRRSLASPMPYGSSIDLSVLQDPRFLELTESPELTLTDDELGKENLFSL